MVLICIIDVIVVLLLVGVTLRKGLEAALPWAAFMLIVIPMESQISLGFFQLTTQRIVILTVVGLYLFTSNTKIRGGRTTPLKWLIVLVVLWDLISTANSVVPVMSIKALLSQSIEYYLLYFVCWKTISDVRTIHRILAAMVAAMVACSIFGVFEVYGRWSVMSLFPAVHHVFGEGNLVHMDAERGLRVSSSFDHPILFGGALALAITTAFYLLSVTSGSRKKLLLWGGIMLMFLNIYKTGSRGPWLALAIGLMLLYIFGNKRMRRPLYAVVLLIAIVFVVRPGIWNTLNGIYANTMNPVTTEYSSYEYRYALKNAAIGALSADPFRAAWGYGMQSFYYLHLTGEWGGKLHVFLSCDSAWIGTMVETGYVGLLLFASLLLTPALIAFRDYRKMPTPNRYLSLNLFANLAIYYFMMIGVAMYSWGQNGYMLWLMIAASMGHRRIWQAEHESEGQQFAVDEAPDRPFAHAAYQ
jgi:hypothetical protein